jgi:predicted transcriptional regulator
MAVHVVTTTYTVDAETKRVLDELASRWAGSRSEALRRAARQAAGAAGIGDRLAAFDALQQQAVMTGRRTRRWAQPVGAERRAARSGKAALR